MKKFIRIAAVICALCIILCLTGCSEPSGSYMDSINTKENANRLQDNQPTPTEGELTNVEWSNLRVLQRKTVYCL